MAILYIQLIVSLCGGDNNKQAQRVFSKQIYHSVVPSNEVQRGFQWSSNLARMCILLVYEVIDIVIY